jgi:hypothetical protein
VFLGGDRVEGALHYLHAIICTPEWTGEDCAQIRARFVPQLGSRPATVPSIRGAWPTPD